MSQTTLSIKGRICRAIGLAIDELNQARPAPERLEKSPETALMGEAARLDSLGLVNLIVGVEERLADEFGVSVAIADERLRSQPGNPLRTIATLADYIASRLQEKGYA